MAARTGASCQKGRLVRDCRPTRSRAAGTACRALGSYGGGEDEGGRVVSGEPWETSALTNSRLEDLSGARTKLRVARTAGVCGQYAIVPQAARELTCP
jgi:hypothetical protein